MKKTALAFAMTTLLSSAVLAETVGVTMARFDDNFLTVLRNDLQAHADGMDGVDVQIEDAQNDVARQLDQINNFVASGVDAIIVNPVDTSATQAMTDAAASANVPLVYVNRQPINLDTLPDNQTFVASNEIESGTLEAFEMCKILRSMGKGGTGARAPTSSWASSRTRPRSSAPRTWTTSSAWTCAASSRSSTVRPRTGSATRPRT